MTVFQPSLQAISHGKTGRGKAISPTDVSQFIRLEQCERYLRLRLHERNVDSRLLERYGVGPQAIAPLLTRSGRAFEEQIEAGFAPALRAFDCSKRTLDDKAREPDGALLLRIARELPEGEARVLLQPRLIAEVGGWLLRGDADIVRIERQENGWHLLIADMKASQSAKNEHRLQLAFYHKMLAASFESAGLWPFQVQTAVLYRGPCDVETLDEDEKLKLEAQLEATERLFGHRLAPLEIVADPDAFKAEVEALVTGASSRAESVATRPFEQVPFHVTFKCDGCLYNEFCMKDIAQRDDLSLLPYLSGSEKTALQRGSVKTVAQLASLKNLRSKDERAVDQSELFTPLENAELVRKLSATWPVGPRLDELIHRARRFRKWKGDEVSALSYIPSKGYGSLPYSDATHNPNLLRIFLDAQHDYLHDRLYLLGAHLVANQNGEVSKRKSVVHLCDGPPDTPEKERDLLSAFVLDLLHGADELVSADEHGGKSAPIHLIFFNGQEQRLLLEGLGRHLTTVLATPLYDLLTQMPAFDSSNVSFLDGELRELSNLPMLCQSLQSVAGFMGFDWNAPQPFKEQFRARLFDGWNRLDEEPSELGDEDENQSEDEARKPSWYGSRARFGSALPLEYAYTAWGELPVPKRGADPFAPYRGVSIEDVRAFQVRRLEAMEHIAGKFKGNGRTEKTAFTLPDLATQSLGPANAVVRALDEFITIERHVEMAAWRQERLAPPERRVLSGQTLLVRYVEDDQSEEVCALNRENGRRRPMERAWREDNPGARMSKDQKAEMGWNHAGTRFRLRLETFNVDADLDTILGVSTLRVGDSVVVCPRLMVDKRLAPEAQTLFTPTPKAMLYGMRADIVAIPVERDASGHAQRAWVEIEISEPRNVKNARGFIFGSFDEPLQPDMRYTLDPNPNDWYGYFCLKAIEELSQGNVNTLFERLQNANGATVNWPLEAQNGQARFLEGLDALGKLDERYTFEESKREFIGSHGQAPVVMVQGPPGTGKSYATAFALFARMQGAMAANIEWRAFCGCKTHAATNVLLDNVAGVQAMLREVRSAHPALFARFFDARLLTAPMFRAGVKEADAPIVPLPKKSDSPKGTPTAGKAVQEPLWCFIGTTPGGVYRMLKDHNNALSGHSFCDCLVLDEASQMNLPEAVMAALALGASGQLIVVGDHRQMPPIVKHNWAFEPRRTFQEFKSYASLFETLLPLQPVLIQFQESFRLHADMAEFLRQEIYRHDGIHYHSKKLRTLPAFSHSDPFVHHVLQPQHAIVVVVHDEASSLLHNPFERELLTPVLQALSDLQTYGLDARHGLGVVVPHRAQRAVLQEAVPQLRLLHPQTGEVVGSAVDTVERFQGGERDAVLVGATESDPEYLLAAGEFLFDPRRLTVAMSRAKQKMILVASRSVFEGFSTDEETFAHAQLWKNLLRRTCTELLWQGERAGHGVQVWGNVSSLPSELNGGAGR